MNFSDKEYWKAIILYGLNNATYKIALGKSLLAFSRGSTCNIQWDKLSQEFLNQYINRLNTTNLPQQGNPTRLTVMERIVWELNSGRISKSDAIARVANEGLNDVIPRFQSIGRNKDLIGNKFYSYEFGKVLTVHDSLFLVANSSHEELVEELNARWSLLEGAFTMSKENLALSNDIREIYLIDAAKKRTCLTSNIPFLQGYQGNTCFYCGEPVDHTDIHVDHVLPWQVIRHDQVWNLVLSHSYCNLNKVDKLVSKHYIHKLIHRNENIMGSNHPWKKKIEMSLGNSAIKRAQSLQRHYENVKAVLGNNYWGGSSSYIPEKDEFYKKFITVLNNGRI